MSDERIDIVVTDKVDPGTERKLAGIEQQAREANTSIAALQAQLAKPVNTAAFDKAAAAASRQALAQAKIAEIDARVTLSQERLALQVAKTGAAYLANESALNRAIAVEQRAAAALAATAAAQSRAAQASAAAAASQASAQARTTAANERAAAAAAASAAAQVKAADTIAVSQQRVAQETAKTAAAQASASAAAARATAVQASAAAQAAAGQARLATATQGTVTAQQRTAAATATTAAAYQRLQTSIVGTTRAQTQATTATTQGATAQQRLATATAQTAAATARAELAQLKLQNAQEKSNTSTNSITGSLVSLAGRLALVKLAYDAVVGAFNNAETFTRFENNLRVVAGSQERLVVLTNELLDVANRSRAPLDAVGTTFTRINNAIKSVGGSQQEAIRITEALTKATATGNLTTEEQASALLQISQAFNKGKLDGDEFRSVMENFPQLGDAIAKSMGFANKALLFEASKEGKINLDVLRNAVVLLGDASDKQLAASQETVAQAFQRLANASVVATGRLNEQLGITKALATAIGFIADLTTDTAKSRVPGGSKADYDLAQAQLAKVNEMIAAEDKLGASIKAGSAEEDKYIKLLQQRADLQQRIANSTQASDDYDDIQRFVNKGLERTRQIKEQADLEVKAAAERKKAEDAANKAAAAARKSSLEQLQHLREQTAELAEQTELQKLLASIGVGKLKGLTPKETGEAIDLASERDLQINRAKLNKQALEDNNALIASREKDAAAINDENNALLRQLDVLQLSEAAQFGVTQAKIADEIASKEFQRDLLISITGITEQTKALDDQARALRQQKELRQNVKDEQFLQANIGQDGLFQGSKVAEDTEIQKMKEKNATIDRLLTERRITEQEAAAARTKVNNDEQQRQLANTSMFFSGLETLSTSKNKTLSRIGKTAAIANATIQGYVAVQNALAVQPYYLGLALAVGAAATTASNIAAIQAQGFQSGGYTGDVGISTIAGVTHGKEFVVNAAATRDNRAELETLNRGGKLQGSSAPNIVVNNLGTPQQYALESITEDRVVLIATDIAKKTVNQHAPSVVAASINEPNSVMSKSLRSNTNAGRNRS